MKNNIRITGGYLKGKNIPFDFKNSLRPTSSKLREVLFNWIQFEIKGMECLDLFAGTGALGIEALSRGCLLYTSPSPRDRIRSRMPSSA